MNCPKLDARLKSAADFIPICDTFLDVGTDHAYLPVYLVKKEICKNAVASDLKKGPLISAGKTAEAYNVSDKIFLRLGSGFETVKPYEVQAAAVAGMGGMLISQLLKASEDTVKTINTLVLQPMTAVYELRSFLYNNGYTIADEVLAKDSGKIYSIMKVHPISEPKPSEAEIFIGRHILKKTGELYEEYKNKQIKKLEVQISGMEKAKTEQNNDKLLYTKKLLCEIKKLISGGIE